MADQTRAPARMREPCGHDRADVPYQQMVDAMPLAMTVVAAGVIVYLNHAAVRLLEATSPLDLLGKPLIPFIHPMDQVRVANRLRRLESLTTANPPTDVRIVTAGGHVRSLRTTSMAVPYGPGSAILIMVTDSTERDRAHQELLESERNFRRLFESMQDVYYRTDASGVVVMVGPGVRRVLGYEPSEIVGQTAEAFYPNPEGRDALKQAIRAHGEVADFEGQMVRRDGRVIDISISSHALYDEHGQFAGIEGIYRDVSDRKALERELRRLATTDALTGIANRRSFLEQATHSLKRCQGHSEGLVLFIVDLDHFKAVNDRYGHVAGDRVLAGFATAAQTALRDTDLFGRLGGEEFCLVLHETDKEQALYVVHRVAAEVRALRFEDDAGTPYRVTVSVGGTASHPKDQGIERLLDRADKALYAAKHSGRDRVEWRD